jgi:glucose-1-phosphate thymidylyltransferase
MPNLQTAISLALKDGHFARDLSDHPEKYREAFGLNDSDVSQLRERVRWTQLTSALAGSGGVDEQAGASAGARPYSPKRIGIIPAAGLGTRLAPLRLQYPKELLPVPAERGCDVQDRPIMEYSVEALRLGGANICQIIVSNSKSQIVEHFGDGSKFDLNFSYLVQTTPLGLAHAVDIAFPWTEGALVCLALPDTIIDPADAVRQLFDEHLAHGADLTLGVFPTATPEQLGPVRLADDGSVLKVLDKPAETDLKNTWGLAVWGDRFRTFLRGAILDFGPSVALGFVFDQARRRGLAARAKYFESGAYADLGTPHGIEQFRASRGMAPLRAPEGPTTI